MSALSDKQESQATPATNANMSSVDGNEAAAWVAYRLSEVCAIYPITPASASNSSARAIWAAVGTQRIGTSIVPVTPVSTTSRAVNGVERRCRGSTWPICLRIWATSTRPS